MIQQEVSSVAFDVIPLPSKGKLYAENKDAVQVEYLTAADENILTSPNLLESGQVYSVLLKRKIKEKNFDIDNMLTGDRNVVLLFLRATGYGHEYPVTVMDPVTGLPFNTNIDLRSLDIKYLEVDPDENGEFTFKLTKTDATVKFRLMTVKMERDLESLNRSRTDRTGIQAISTLYTDRLEMMIQSINGNRDKMFIRRFISEMPAVDSLAFRRYVAQIEPDVDMSTTVIAPSGNPIRVSISIDSAKFFWLDF